MLNDLEPIDLLLLLLHMWYMPVLNCDSKSTPAVMTHDLLELSEAIVFDDLKIVQNVFVALQSC
jgi:hypothetical protein